MGNLLRYFIKRIETAARLDNSTDSSADRLGKTDRSQSGTDFALSITSCIMSYEGQFFQHQEKKGLFKEPYLWAHP